MITKNFVGTSNGGISCTIFTRLFWGVGETPLSRIHTACIDEDSPILGTNEMFGDVMRVLGLERVGWTEGL